MAKSDNMLSVLRLLESRGRMTAAQIAEELETSVRTVYRYIDSLCASGAPIVSDSGHEGGYWLTEEFRGTPLFFRPTEVSSLVHATKFAQRSGYPYRDVLQGAIQKLQRTLTPHQNTQLKKHVDGFGVIQNLRGGSTEQWLGTLEHAVAECKTLDMLYHKLKADEPEWRRVDPYGLAFSAGAWYVAVYCHTRQALRAFRVDRIKDISVTESIFARPLDFSVDDYFSDGRMQEWIRSQPPVRVRVEGKAWAISAVCDHWFFRHCLLEHDRTEVILQIPASSLDEAATYLIAHGDSIQVCEPAELRDKITDICHVWAKHFAENREVH